jgi:glutathione synthase
MEKILAFQADSLESLKKESDTSLYLASYLQKSHYKIFFYEAKDLSFSTEVGTAAKGFFISVEDLGRELSYEKRSDLTFLPLREARAVFIRQDPPFDLNYLLSTQLLSLLPKEVLILNKPEVLRDHIEKSLPFYLANQLQDRSFLPRSLISNNPQELVEFLSTEKEIIVKPLYSFGGDEVVKITNKAELLDHLKDRQTTLIAQKFLSSVYKGDRRLLVYDRKILGLLERIPSEGSYLTNTIRGSKVKLGSIQPHEEKFFTRLVEALPEGLFFAGLDFIDNYLIEVNITSPGLLYSFKNLAGEVAVKPFFDNLLDKLEGKND